MNNITNDPKQRTVEHIIPSVFITGTYTFPTIYACKKCNNGSKDIHDAAVLRGLTRADPSATRRSGVDLVLKADANPNTNTKNVFNKEFLNQKNPVVIQDGDESNECVIISQDRQGKIDHKIETFSASKAFAHYVQAFYLITEGHYISLGQMKGFRFCPPTSNCLKAKDTSSWAYHPKCKDNARNKEYLTLMRTAIDNNLDEVVLIGVSDQIEVYLFKGPNRKFNYTIKINDLVFRVSFKKKKKK